MGRLIEKTIGGIRLTGFSLAGEETVVAVPEYNVCFDVGRAPREIIALDHLCLTHGHMDHAAGIAYYFSQRTFLGLPPGRLLMPKPLVPLVRRLMAVWEEIERHPSPGDLVGVGPMEDVELRRGLIVRAFDVTHGADALGYTLIEVRHKLKPEFHGKTGPQLVALKREGVEIERRVEVPLLTYTGDTAVGRWMHYDFVRKSPVVLVECTFFDRDHLRRAREGKHIHLVDLPQVFEAIPDAEIVLMHVSRRTDLREAKRLVQRALPDRDRERVRFLMERPPREKRPRTANKTAAPSSS